jgi:hypothetical protein
MGAKALATTNLETISEGEGDAGIEVVPAQEVVAMTRYRHARERGAVERHDLALASKLFCEAQFDDERRGRRPAQGASG